MKKHMNMVKAYRSSKFGRAVARLFGEETGAVMMEYVVVAVVIAAACALVMAIWGKAIFGQSKAATQAVVVNPHAAEQTIEQNRSNTEAGHIEAKGNADKIHGDVQTKTL